MKKKQKSFFNKKNKGFTVAEILVVIAIITLLSSVILVATKEARNRARIARGLQFSASIYHALGDEAVGIWNFEEKEPNSCSTEEPYNDICDSSGNENHGKAEGTLSYVDSVIANTQALSSGGSGTYGYVEVKPSKSLAQDIHDAKAITIEGWVRPTSPQNTFYLVWRNQRAYTFGYAIGDKKVFFVIDGLSKPTLNSKSTDYIKAGKWYHLAATYDGSKRTIYIDGKEDGSDDFTDDIPSDSTDPILLGLSPYGAGELHVDRIRIYKAALTSAQIYQHYVQGAKKRGLTIK